MSASQQAEPRVTRSVSVASTEKLEQVAHDCYKICMDSKDEATKTGLIRALIREIPEDQRMAVFNSLGDDHAGMVPNSDEHVDTFVYKIISALNEEEKNKEEKKAPIKVVRRSSPVISSRATAFLGFIKSGRPQAEIEKEVKEMTKKWRSTDWEQVIDALTLTDDDEGPLMLGTDTNVPSGHAFRWRLQFGCKPTTSDSKNAVARPPAPMQEVKKVEETKIPAPAPPPTAMAPAPTQPVEVKESKTLEDKETKTEAAKVPPPLPTGQKNTEVEVEMKETKSEEKKEEPKAVPLPSTEKESKMDVGVVVPACTEEKKDTLAPVPTVEEKKESKTPPATAPLSTKEKKEEGKAAMAKMEAELRDAQKGLLCTALTKALLENANNKEIVGILARLRGPLSVTDMFVLSQEVAHQTIFDQARLANCVTEACKKLMPPPAPKPKEMPVPSPSSSSSSSSILPPVMSSSSSPSSSILPPVMSSSSKVVIVEDRIFDVDLDVETMLKIVDDELRQMELFDISEDIKMTKAGLRDLYEGWAEMVFDNIRVQLASSPERFNTKPKLQAIVRQMTRPREIGGGEKFEAALHIGLNKNYPPSIGPAVCRRFRRPDPLVKPWLAIKTFCEKWGEKLKCDDKALLFNDVNTACITVFNCSTKGHHHEVVLCLAAIFLLASGSLAKAITALQYYRYAKEKELKDEKRATCDHSGAPLAPASSAQLDVIGLSLRELTPDAALRIAAFLERGSAEGYGKIRVDETPKFVFPDDTEEKEAEDAETDEEDEVSPPPEKKAKTPKKKEEKEEKDEDVPSTRPLAPYWLNADLVLEDSGITLPRQGIQGYLDTNGTRFDKNKDKAKEVLVKWINRAYSNNFGNLLLDSGGDLLKKLTDKDIRAVIVAINRSYDVRRHDGERQKRLPAGLGKKALAKKRKEEEAKASFQCPLASPASLPESSSSPKPEPKSKSRSASKRKSTSTNDSDSPFELAGLKKQKKDKKD